MKNDWLQDSIIFGSIVGSHMYGLQSPESDIDVMGICIPPIEFVFGTKQFDTWTSKDVDMTIHSIKKFFSLALKSNPTILELLFAPKDCIIKTTKWWDIIISNRDIFLSKKVKHSYLGYAGDQIKRVRSHRNWLLNPPIEKPNRKDYGLPEFSRLSGTTFGAIDYIIKNSENQDKDLDRLEVDSLIIDIFSKEKSFRSAKKNYEQYLNWKENRNPVRAKLEEKYGYDTKHMSHVFRLLLQAIDVLDEGTLFVRLSERNIKLCKEVRNGKYNYDELINLYEEFKININNLYESSTLSNLPNYDKANDLLVDILTDYFFNKGE